MVLGANVIHAAASATAGLFPGFLCKEARMLTAAWDRTTIGIEFGSQIVKVKNRSVKLQIWDTAGQESFRSISRAYYRVTRRDTFSHLISWLEDVKQHGNEEIKTALIANKCDQAARRQVSREEGEAFAKKHDLLYFEASARSGQSVEEAFLAVATSIFDHLRLDRDASTFTEQELRKMEGHGVKLRRQDDDGDIVQRIAVLRWVAANKFQLSHLEDFGLLPVTRACLIRKVMELATQSSSGQQLSAVTAPNPHQTYLKRAPSPEILDEDRYIDAVSDIIERDFFPGLKKLKLQNEFLDAVNQSDYARAKVLGTEIQRLATGYRGSDSNSSINTPNPHRGIETPLVTGFTPLDRGPGADTPSFHTPATPLHNPPAPSLGKPAPSTLEKGDAEGNDDKLDTNMSLDAFQTKYTSEDNASFTAILKKQNEDQRKTYSWYFEKESGRLLLEGGDVSAAGTRKQITDKNGKVLEHVVAPIDSWKFRAKNSLMYHMDSAPETLADLKDNKGPPKAINHNATRFHAEIPTSEVLKASRDAAERLATQEVWRDMAKATPALFPNGDPNSATPDVAGAKAFGFVPSTPSLEPHADVNPEDLMTWGMIEGTPMLLDSGSDHRSGGPAFSMAPTPRREQIGDKLADEAAKSLRRRAVNEGALASKPFLKPAMRATRSLGAVIRGTRATPTPGSSWAEPSPNPRAPSPLMTLARAAGVRPVVTPMLSPAAQKLLSARSGVRASPLAVMARGLGGDQQLRASYSLTPGGVAKAGSIRGTPRSQRPSVTPSPVVRRVKEEGRQPGAKAVEAAAAAPVVVTTASEQDLLEKSKQGSITDNLLNF
ncbi:Ras- protein Rab-2A [Irineochytrium annulatum]|nr:Ras- protein Rab-2A [Irineochytrium annulatum]